MRRVGFACAVILVGVFNMSSCSDGKRVGDADTDADGETPAEVPADVDVEDDEPVPIPCAVDRDCTDNDPCNGNERCDPETLYCVAGESQPDGVICSLDPRRICLTAACSESACGDGFLDPGSEEFCEPPEVGDCDDACLLICDGDPDCESDDNPCNGVEYCDTDTSRCSRHDRPEDGRPCSQDPRGICLGGLCTDSICGDGFLDVGGGEFCDPPYEADCDGGCLLLCGGDPDCLDDGEVCNGVEYCDMDTSRCSRRSVPPAGTACDDHDAATGPDQCDGAGSCVGETGCTLETVVAFSAGSGHTCVLLDSGDMQCWGNNASGQLGDGTTTDRATAVDVADLASGASAVAAGNAHTCALLDSGGVQCWGNNGSGQLGDGTRVGRLSPVDVTGLASGVTAISAGYEHTCALQGSGGIRCWGDNSFGQLGDGTTTDMTSPVHVTGLTTGVQSVEAGSTHTCAVLLAGGVQCWGDNGSGQIGDGTTVSRLTAVDVVDLASDASSVAADNAFTCALLDTGGVQCWGDNGSGQLGNGTTVGTLVPVDVTGLSSGVTAITLGGRHACALLDAGGVVCWGSNESGQLGDGTTTSRLTATDVEGVSSGVSAVTAGSGHTCALLDTGGVRCWGLNDFGQLGNGTTTSSLTAVDVSTCP